MVSVFDVAKYILKQKGNVSIWRLNGLCYYSQAWHFAWTYERLIKEEFRAWKNGAVCVELLKYLAGKFIVHAEDITSATAFLTDDEKESIDVVLKDYGDRAPYMLTEQIKFEAPWRIARGDKSADKNSDAVIKLADMGEYYGSLIEDEEDDNED